jgi:tol-pal system protein YbgF
MSSVRRVIALAAIAVSAAASSAVAQQAAPPQGTAPRPPASSIQSGPVGNPLPPTGQPPAQKRPTSPSGSAAPAESRGGGEQALRARVEQLEEQIIDLQVAIGTLETLAKAPGAGAASSGGLRSLPATTAGADAVRVDSVEVQLRALLAQVERLTDRVAAIEGGRPASGGSAAAPPPTARAPAASRPVEGFGQTIVTPGGAAGGDSIGSLLRDDPPPPSGGRQASLGDPAGAANPRQMYETAYGYLLQQDYGAAEAAFTEFLSQYPNDALAGNAQYWLGETYFVRGQFKTAASAFLKGYQTYARSSKAPDSLLKLAMSLDRLGQRDAACSSFGELQTRFPQAPAPIRARAQTERQRLGC